MGHFWLIFMYLAEKQTKGNENDMKNDVKNGYREHPGKENLEKMHFSLQAHCQKMKNDHFPVGSRPSVPFELWSADMPERLQVTAGWNETILTESRIVTLDLTKFWRISHSHTVYNITLRSCLEIVAGNPGVFQLYPYPYPPNPYSWPGVRVLEGKCTGLHGFGEFGGFGKFCRLMSLKTYIHICIA